MEETKAFLGRGFAFPPRVDSATGKFVMVESEDDIKEAIYIILMTRMKERAMLPEFGSTLQDALFDLPDASFDMKISQGVIQALTDFEPRIRNVSVKVDKRNIANGIVYFNIDYTVRATNNPNNLVFPYYLEEGIGEL